MAISDRCLMTWEPAKSRWRKMYKSKVYTVTCESLAVPTNKERSYQAANAWWTKKKLELDSNTDPVSHPFIHDELSRRREWARSNDPDIAAEMTHRLDRLTKADDDEAVHLALTPDLDERIEALKDLGITIPDSISRTFLDTIIGDGRVWRARHNQTAPRVPEERTVGAQVAKYLGRQRERVASGKPSVSEYDLISRTVKEFETWLGPESSVDAITVDKWEDWYYHVLKLDCSVETKKKRYRHPRAFVEWLVEKKTIEPPANLASRKFRFEGGQQKIPTMTREEVKALIDAAPGQLKLHLLLMANCGYTQTDIAELRPDQVDWEKGRIRRKRSKTEDHANVPEVDYKLWPATFNLLCQHGHREGDLALLTKSGLPWVRDVMDSDGVRKKVDAIKSNYAHLAKKGFSRPMKLLRKTSATLIESRKDFAPYSSHFLGHSPRTIKDRSYTPPNEAIFDEAIEWLGRQYGMMDE
jgi:integrase